MTPPEKLPSTSKSTALLGLKPKGEFILLSKNINYNKNQTESKMENPTHSFKETNLVLELI